MDLLDTLRGLRQTHANLRMIYTGSIGLHHVVTALREEGYVNSPVNDMRTVEVPPLDDGHAEALAKALIQGEGLISSAPDETAAIIAKRVDAIPFYIHHVVAAMADRGQAATPEIAERSSPRRLRTPRNGIWSIFEAGWALIMASALKWSGRCWISWPRLNR